MAKTFWFAKFGLRGRAAKFEGGAVAKKFWRVGWQHLF